MAAAGRLGMSLVRHAGAGVPIHGLKLPARLAGGFSVPGGSGMKRYDAVLEDELHHFGRLVLAAQYLETEEARQVVCGDVTNELRQKVLANGGHAWKRSVLELVGQDALAAIDDDEDVAMDVGSPKSVDFGGASPAADRVLIVSADENAVLRELGSDDGRGEGRRLWALCFTKSAERLRMCSLRTGGWTLPSGRRL